MPSLALPDVSRRQRSEHNPEAGRLIGGSRGVPREELHGAVDPRPPSSSYLS